MWRWLDRVALTPERLRTIATALLAVAIVGQNISFWQYQRIKRADPAPEPTPRRWTDTRQTMLAATLPQRADCEARINFTHESETERFAQDVGAMFQRAGWRILYSPFLNWERREGLDPPAGGIALVVAPNNARTQGLETALSELGSPVRRIEDAQQQGCNIDVRIADQAR